LAVSALFAELILVAAVASEGAKVTDSPCFPV
jgi:hypothetical protein